MDQRDYHNLSILKTLETAPATTMRLTAAKLGVSVKLAHSLIKGLVARGLVHTTQRDGRSLSYLLTAAGLKEKARLTYEFIDFSSEFFHEARRRSSQVCHDLAASGIRKVAFLGCGDLAEITYLGVLQHGLRLIAVYDDAPASRQFLAHSVHPTSDLTSALAQARFERVLVTAYDPRQPHRPNPLPRIKTDDPRFVWALAETATSSNTIGTADQNH